MVKAPGALSRARQKEQSRERILKAAAELFRAEGFAACGVDALMEEAGLTAGAFYAHFASKKQLLAEALRYSLDQSYHSLVKGTEGLTASQRGQAIMARYLSPQHRDTPSRGCPLVSIAAELARQDQDVKDIIAEYLSRLAGLVAEGLVNVPAARRRQEALALISQAVGALMLSRLTAGTALSDRILRSPGMVSGSR